MHLMGRQEAVEAATSAVRGTCSAMRCVCTRSVKQAAMSAGVGGEEEEEEEVEEGVRSSSQSPPLLEGRVWSSEAALWSAMAQRQWPTKWS